MQTEIVRITHLAKRALDDVARMGVEGEKIGNEWDVLMSAPLAEKFREGATARNMSVSDYILHLYRGGVRT